MVDWMDVVARFSTPFMPEGLLCLFLTQYLEQGASPSFSSLPVTKAGQAGEPIRLAHTWAYIWKL